METTADIAKGLHISEESVRGYAREGLIPFLTTPGGHRRYVLADVKMALRRAGKLSYTGIEQPLRRAGEWRSSITPAMIADARAADGESREFGTIPRIAIPGTTRFVLNNGASARG